MPKSTAKSASTSASKSNVGSSIGSRSNTAKSSLSSAPKWPQPSIADLKRAALGKSADLLDDDELDALAAR